MEMQMSCDPMVALNEALCSEQEGYDFYLEAAQKTEHPAGAQMFHHLAKAAGAQTELLETQIEALTRDNTWMLPECVLECDFDVEAAPFPRDQAAFEREIGVDTSDRDAIIFAMQAENVNYGRYVQQAKASANPQARQFYAYLAEQTRTRLDLLMLNYEGVSANAVALSD
jgi:rubrerythrin